MTGHETISQFYLYVSGRFDDAVQSPLLSPHCRFTLRTRGDLRPDSFFSLSCNDPVDRLTLIPDTYFYYVHNFIMTQLQFKGLTLGTRHYYDSLTETRILYTSLPKSPFPYIEVD